MKTMRKLILLGIIITLLVLPMTAVYAAPPPDGPPGLQRAIEVKERHAEALLGVPGVVGAAVGHNGNSNPAIIIFTAIPGVRGLPTSLEGVPVIVQVSGIFFAQPKPEKKGNGKPPKDEEPALTPRDRWLRPVPIDVSTGHPDITAGTIGARVVDDSGNVYALSNNHIYANENEASIGDAVIQPGTYDDGISPVDDIGTLFAYVAIDFDGGINVVDAAIASTTTTLLGNSTPSDGYGTPKLTLADAYINMKVKKYGRTTGQTKGRVYATNATIDVHYGSGIARFVNQIVITPGAFSAGGDSGSLIVVDAKRSPSDRQPVGLLFAGSSFYTIANPIEAVLTGLKVAIDGE